MSAKPAWGRALLGMAALAFALPASARGEGGPRLVLLSLDGGGAEALGAAMRQGDMPALDALRRKGVQALHAIPAFPAKTAVGHATLWTGAPPWVHGVAGNRTDPEAEHPLQGPWASVGGYDSTVLRATPVYAHMARHGLKVLAFNCTHSAPVSAYAPGGRHATGLGDRLAIFDGFELPFGPDGVWALGRGLLRDERVWPHPPPPSERPPVAWKAQWAGRSWRLLSVADANSAQVGYDGIWVQAEATSSLAASPLVFVAAEAAATPAALGVGWSSAIEVAPEAYAYLRAFEVDSATGAPLLFHTAPSKPRTNRASWLPALRAAGGGFAPGMGGHAYHHGGFGPSLAEGGSGQAEARYLESLTFANRLQLAALGHLMKRERFDAVFTYLPLPDQVEHQWTGYMVPGPVHQPSLARSLMPYWRAAFVLADQAVGNLRAGAPAAIMAVSSDHGMAGVAWDFRTNVRLREAGLLRQKADGSLDVGGSLISMPPHLGPALRLHQAGRWAGARLTLSQRQSTLAAAKKALMGVMVKGPNGVLPLLTRWVEAGSPAAQTLGLARGVDVAFDLQPGYGVDGGLAGHARFVARPPNAAGTHLHDPTRPDMHAIFMASGPGLREGVLAPAVRLEDVAPTLLQWMALPPLPQARGRAQSHWMLP